VPLSQRDELGSARLNGDYALAVRAFPNVNSSI
jgi:hypothetical protein